MTDDAQSKTTNALIKYPLQEQREKEKEKT
jgi:hypothetical protein